MSDYSELKTAATRIIEVQTSQDVPINKLFDEFDALASPEAVLALISEVDSLNDEISACKTSPGGCSYWKEAACMREQERDQLKAEVERPKKQEAWGWGLPPVNCFCETLDEDADCWVKVEIYAHTEFMGETHACAKNGTDMFFGLAHEFRPIKTAEQLAEEEIQAIRDEIRWQKPQLGPCPVAQLYNKGYRKQ